jgi:hypothetical protein
VCRGRLKAAGLRAVYLDGRPRQDEQQGPMAQGLIGTMISQLRDAVRGAVESWVVVLPHLDLLTTSMGGLTAEAKEVIPLLCENPELVWLGFKDPSFPIPRVIENLFPHRVSLLGIARPRLRHLVTQKEARKFGRQFNPWALYKHVSGMNAVRLRRLLSTLEGEDYPADPERAYRKLHCPTPHEVPEDVEGRSGCSHRYSLPERPHAVAAGGPPARRRGPLGQGDRRRPADLAPHRRVPQGPPHGHPGRAQHGRTDPVRHPHGRHLRLSGAALCAARLP